MHLDLFDFASERSVGQARAPEPTPAWDAPDSTLWGRAWLDNVGRLYQTKYASEMAFGEKLLSGGRMQALRVRRGHVQGSFTNPAGGAVLVNVEVKPLSAERWLALDRLCERCGDTLFTSDEQPAEVLAALFGQPGGLLPNGKELAFACSHCRSPFCLYRAATLLAAASEFDRVPMKLFELRGAPRELLLMRSAQQASDAPEELSEEELSSVFGIELDKPS